MSLDFSLNINDASKTRVVRMVDGVEVEVLPAAGSEAEGNGNDGKDGSSGSSGTADTAVVAPVAEAALVPEQPAQPAATAIEEVKTDVHAN